MNKKMCEQCKTAIATVLFQKGEKPPDWWFCLDCFITLGQTELLTDVRVRLKGIPDGSFPI